MPLPTPTPGQLPILEDARWLAATLIALFALGLSIANAIRAWLRDQRKLLVEATWDWLDFQNGTKIKELWITVTNPRPTPVTMNVFVSYRDKKEEDVVFTERYKLEEGDSKNNSQRCYQHEQVAAIFAKDTLGKRWHVPRPQLKSVQSSKSEPIR